jgi:hypothetical protein
MAVCGFGPMSKIGRAIVVHARWVAVGGAARKPGCELLAWEKGLRQPWRHAEGGFQETAGFRARSGPQAEVRSMTREIRGSQSTAARCAHRVL